MKPSAIFDIKRHEIREVLDRFGMRNPRVFGSAARRDDRGTSDLDILVHAPPATSLYDLAAVEIELEGALGCRVEVITEGFMSPDALSRAKRDFTPVS